MCPRCRSPHVCNSLLGCTIVVRSPSTHGGSHAELLLSWLERDSLGLLFSKSKHEVVTGGYCVEYDCEWTAAHTLGQYRRTCLATQLHAALTQAHGTSSLCTSRDAAALPSASASTQTELSFSVPTTHTPGKRLNRMVHFHLSVTAVMPADFVAFPSQRSAWHHAQPA